MHSRKCCEKIRQAEPWQKNSISRSCIRLQKFLHKLLPTKKLMHNVNTRRKPLAPEICPVHPWTSKNNGQTQDLQWVK